MIREELKHLSTRPRDLRKFGLLVGGVFAAIGAWFPFRHTPIGPWLLASGAILILLGVVAPRVLRPAYIAWMALAFTLRLIVSTLILSLFFFLVVTPTGLLARVAGKDFLSLKLRPKAASYWLARPSTGPGRAEDYEQQF